MTDAPARVVMRGIRKAFPGVVALDDVDFTIRAGEVVGLAGENGSGKSSLMKILAGRYQPDAGDVAFEGRSVRFSTPADALRAGIGLVAQEVLVQAHLTVAENLALGDLPRTRLGMVDHRRLREHAEAMLARVGLHVDPKAVLGRQPLRVQQMVSILKMAARRPQVLILDEPTSALGEAEVRGLYGLVRELAGAGTAVVYVTHRLREYFELCSRVTVLRDGVVTADRRIDEIDESRLIELMVGRGVDLAPKVAPAVRPAAAAPRLEIRDLCVGTKLTDISLRVGAGEIVGVAGQAGAGRSTLARALFGLHPHTGTIAVDGEPVRLHGARAAKAAGIAYVPEDRKQAGLVLSMSVADNVSMTRWREIRRFGVVSEQEKRRLTAEAIRSMHIRVPSGSTIVRNLSGGNQQKVVLGKWIATDPKVLLLDEPTRGIDVGAKHEVYQLVEQFVARGLAVVVFSSELSELLHLCDRIVVLHRGRVAGELAAGDANEENVTSLAFGHAVPAPSITSQGAT